MAGFARVTLPGAMLMDSIGSPDEKRKSSYAVGAISRRRKWKRQCVNIVRLRRQPLSAEETHFGAKLRLLTLYCVPESESMNRNCLHLYATGWPITRYPQM